MWKEKLPFSELSLLLLMLMDWEKEDSSQHEGSVSPSKNLEKWTEQEWGKGSSQDIWIWY